MGIVLTVVMILRELILYGSKLKLPATSCGESPTVKEYFIFIRSLTPPQAAGNALAVQFKYRPLSVDSDNMSQPNEPLSYHKHFIGTLVSVGYGPSCQKFIHLRDRLISRLYRVIFTGLGKLESGAVQADDRRPAFEGNGNLGKCAGTSR